VPVAAPCDHVTVPAQPLAVRFKVAGVQTDTALVKVIVGADGVVLTMTEAVAVAVLNPFVTVTV
jgi:hypothetical protein